MENEKLYLVKFNDEFLLHFENDLISFISEAELSKLSVTGNPVCYGKVEEDYSKTFSLYLADTDFPVKALENTKLFKREEIFIKESSPGDKLCLKAMLEGNKKIDLVVVYKEGKLVTAYSRARINPFIAFFKHLHTVNRHRRLVRHSCFKVGLIWQGLTHDLSKYSYTEFSVGVKYYQGTRSPNVAERMTKGYSTAWLHHKGRNRHHQEYWTDYDTETGELLAFKEMPKKYFIESIMDRIAACKVYRGSTYNDGAALDYLMTRDSESHMNKKNRDDMIFLLTMLKEKGEKETFRYIKKVYLK